MLVCMLDICFLSLYMLWGELTEIPWIPLIFKVNLLPRAWSSNELQWFQLKVKPQKNSTPSNSHQHDVHYSQKQETYV